MCSRCLAFAIMFYNRRPFIFIFLIKLKYPDTKVKFLSISKKVIVFKDYSGLCFKDFYDGSIFANLLLCHPNKMFQNRPDSPRIKICDMIATLNLKLPVT
jgi:hypothetical protein